MDRYGIALGSSKKPKKVKKLLAPEQERILLFGTRQSAALEIILHTPYKVCCCSPNIHRSRELVDRILEPIARRADSVLLNSIKKRLSAQVWGQGADFIGVDTLYFDIEYLDYDLLDALLRDLYSLPNRRILVAGDKSRWINMIENFDIGRWQIKDLGGPPPRPPDETSDY